MPESSFYLFVQSVINFSLRLVTSLFNSLQWLCYLSPLPDWLDWSLISLLVIGILLAVFLAAPGKK